MDLICRLLDKDKSTRLGSKDDFVEVLNHPYFKDSVDIESLENKANKPPFVPNFGKKNIEELFNVQNSKSAMGDTYIPRDNRKIIKSNEEAFDKFNFKNEHRQIKKN